MSKLGLVSVTAFVILVIVGFFLIIANESEKKQRCEDLGGHIYERQVGKIHYEKCVTDDDQVIVL